MVVSAQQAQVAVSTDPHLYRAIFELAPDAIIAVSLPDLTILAANASAHVLMGLSHDSNRLVGRNIDHLYTTTSYTPERSILSLALLKTPGHHEAVWIERSGEEGVYAAVSVGHQGENLAICTLRDSTHRHALEQELLSRHMDLRQTHAVLLEASADLERRNREVIELSYRMAILTKRAAIGELTAGVAHGINNPLAAAISTTRQIRRLLPGMSSEALRPRIEELLSRLTETHTRMQQVVTDLRSAYRGAAPREDATAVSLAAELESALSLFSHRLHDVEVIREFTDTPKLWGHPDALQHLMCNLIDNALAAMEDQAQVGRKCLTLRIAPSADDPHRLELWCIDSGPGVRPGVREKLFQAFVSGRTGGTGLGLCIAARIAQAHHGRLTLAFTGSQGTAFLLSLPANPPTKPSPGNS